MTLHRSPKSALTGWHWLGHIQVGNRKDRGGGGWSHGCCCILLWWEWVEFWFTSRDLEARWVMCVRCHGASRCLAQEGFQKTSQVCLLSQLLLQKCTVFPSWRVHLIQFKKLKVCIMRGERSGCFISHMSSAVNWHSQTGQEHTAGTFPAV